MRQDGALSAGDIIFSGHTGVGGGAATVRPVLETFSDGDIRLTFTNTAGTNSLVFGTTGQFLAVGGWHHVLMAWDVANSVEQIYVDDASDVSVLSSINETLDYTLSDWAIGGYADGTFLIDGCLAEFYFAPGQYLDISLVHNRRKFRSAAGKPVHLGTTGALPTGTAPLIYLHLDDAEAVANFATNRGTGGNFTIAGTLQTGSTSPSD
jgi:hypothetical protein